ncbi:unnamed protein product, partial [Owenia fusiformis]
FRNMQGVWVRVARAGLLFAVPTTLSYKVFAAEDKQLVKRNELPIYDVPSNDDAKYEYVDEHISGFRENVSTVRRQVWTYMARFKETTDRIKEIYETGKAHTQGTIYYIQNDPGILPRAGVITVAGLGGIVAGYKGGVLKKGTYSVISMTAALSLCYPNQAVDITRRGYKRVILEARQVLNIPEKPAVQPDELLKPQTTSQVAPKGFYDNKKEDEECEHCKSESKPGTPAKDTIVPPPTSATTPITGDKGQSKDEDKDMYTTRS